MLRCCVRRSSSLAWRRLHGEAAVWEARLAKPWRTPPAEGAYMLRAEGLVPVETMEAARRLALDPGLRLDRDDDSVDGSPTFELKWVSEGQYTHPGLASVFQDMVEAQLLPLLKRSPLARGVDLVLCEALLRVYDEGARRIHPAHYDADALVTAVLEIDTSPRGDRCTAADGRASDCRAAKGFDGPGFYVQPGAHVSSRLPISLAPGDVIAHSFDLQHGVHVTGGRRCSVIFWFTDSASSCVDKSRPWYEAAAAAGDPDAQYNVGRELDRAGTDPKRAQAWPSRCAYSSISSHRIAPDPDPIVCCGIPAHRIPPDPIVCCGIPEHRIPPTPVVCCGIPAHRIPPDPIVCCGIPAHCIPPDPVAGSALLGSGPRIIHGAE